MNITLSQFSEFACRMSDWHKIAKGHEGRTALLSLAIGECANLSPERLHELSIAAEMHDIGRVGVGNDLLNKRGPLTDSERAAIRAHSQIGYDLVHSYIPEEIALAILHHHENYDGTGYPRGLSGEAIPLFARIIRIADHWDALRNDRPYRDALGFDVALRIINIDERHFDPALYVHFLDIIRRGNW